MILPAGDTVINEGPFTSGASAFKEFWYVMTAFASEAQSIDGNGSLVNTATGGGDTLIKTGKLSGPAQEPRRPLRPRPHEAARHPAGPPVQEAEVRARQGLLQEREAEPERPRGDPRPARPGAALEEGPVRHAISKNLREFIAVILMILIALVVGGYILSNQRFYLPAWVPVLGTDFFELKAQFSTAQSVTPGQGQTAEIAGVPVGEIKRVELVDGRAVVTMAIRAKYRDMIKRDATMLLRPKTGLKDMVIEVDPGTRGRPEVPEGYTIPVAQTRPDVNLDEILANLDRDTRDYLRLLVAGGGEGLKDNGPAFRNAFRRFEPLGKTTAKLTKLLAQRRRHLARLIHNLQLLVTEVGTKDKELAELVVSQNAVFEAFANQDANLRETFQLLPDTLQDDELCACQLGRADRAARPDAAQSCARASARSTMRSARRPTSHARPFRRSATRCGRSRVRQQPAAKALRPAARDLAKITPQLEKSFDVINTLLNALGYNPPGTEEGYLFWALWLNHIGASVYSTQDAHGLVRRGIIFTDCIALGALEATRKIDNQLGTLIDLSNFATKQEACG